MRGIYDWLADGFENPESKTEKSVLHCMLSALIHGLREGRIAGQMAVDVPSSKRLRADFFWSRLLKLG